MNIIYPAVFSVFGMLLGMLLYQLPVRLFFRRTTWLTQEEFLAAFPEKRWVTRAMYVLLPLGFILFVVLVSSAEDMTKGINWFFFFPVFFCCMGMMPAIPELLAKASVLIPVGHAARSPVLFTFSPNARGAGVFRLAMTSVVVAVFLWCR